MVISDRHLWPVMPPSCCSCFKPRSAKDGSLLNWSGRPSQLSLEGLHGLGDWHKEKTWCCFVTSQLHSCTLGFHYSLVDSLRRAVAGKWDPLKNQGSANFRGDLSIRYLSRKWLEVSITFLGETRKRKVQEQFSGWRQHSIPGLYLHKQIEHQLYADPRRHGVMCFGCLWLSSLLLNLEKQCVEEVNVRRWS